MTHKGLDHAERGVRVLVHVALESLAQLVRLGALDGEAHRGDADSSGGGEGDACKASEEGHVLAGDDACWVVGLGIEGCPVVGTQLEEVAQQKRRPKCCAQVEVEVTAARGFEKVTTTHGELADDGSAAVCFVHTLRKLVNHKPLRRIRITIIFKSITDGGLFAAQCVCCVPT